MARLNIRSDDSFRGLQKSIEGLDDSMDFGDFLELVRTTFEIPEQEYSKYRLLGPFAANVKGLVDPSKSLRYVREEFGIVWGSSLLLEKVIR